MSERRFKKRTEKPSKKSSIDHKELSEQIQDRHDERIQNYSDEWAESELEYFTDKYQIFDSPDFYRLKKSFEDLARMRNERSWHRGIHIADVFMAGRYSIAFSDRLNEDALITYLRTWKKVIQKESDEEGPVLYETDGIKLASFLRVERRRALSIIKRLSEMGLWKEKKKLKSPYPYSHRKTYEVGKWVKALGGLRPYPNLSGRNDKLMMFLKNFIRSL